MSNEELNENEYFYLVEKYLRAGEVNTAEKLLNDKRY